MKSLAIKHTQQKWPTPVEGKQQAVYVEEDLPPVPQHLAANILVGEFVEMHELLPEGQGANFSRSVFSGRSRCMQATSKRFDYMAAVLCI